MNWQLSRAYGFSTGSLRKDEADKIASMSEFILCNL